MRLVAVTAALVLLTTPGVAFAQPLAGPGRVVFPNTGAPSSGTGRVPSGFIAGTALADGRLVLLRQVTVRASVPGAELKLYRLLADGRLDSQFGAGGVATVRMPALPSGVPPQVDSRRGLQVLDRGGGRVLVVALVHSAIAYAVPPLVLIALTERGALDPAFGRDGFAETGVGAGSAEGRAAAVMADGRVVVAGSTGTPTVVQNGVPITFGETHWSIARLLPDGTPDASFGTGGVATLAGERAGGFGVTPLADGGVATIGQRSGQTAVARLLPDGAPDASFNGGEPVGLTGVAPEALFERSDGALDVAGVVSLPASATAQVERVSRSGAVSAVAGASLAAGTIPSASLLAAPGGGEWLVLAPRFSFAGEDERVALRDLSGDGPPGAPLSARVPFGGGRSTAVTGTFRYSQPPAEQMRLEAVPAFAAGARIVLAGAVVVAEPAGEEDTEQRNAAVAAFTPALALDSTFGGPAARPAVRLKLPRRITVDAVAPSVTVRVRSGSPGLAAVRVRLHGRVVARETAPVWSSGWSSVRVLLTRSGARRLRREHAVDLRATARFADLLGAVGNATASRGAVTIQR